MIRFRTQIRLLLAAAACTALVSCGGGGGTGDGGSGGAGGSPLNITTTFAVDGVVGDPYSQSIVAAGGQGARTFTLSAGALPPGLTLSSAGNIDGTPAGPPGTSNFTVSVSDSAPTPATDSQALTIDIVEPLSIETATVSDTAIGADYFEPVVAVGGTPPYSYGLSGSPPSGLRISASGTLNGRISREARTGVFDVEVTDSSVPMLAASRTYQVAVDMEVATAALAQAEGGVEYIDSLDVLGGLPPFTWQILSGSLPAGLAMSQDGTVSGTPDPVCGESRSTLHVQAADSDAPVQIDDRSGIDLRLVPTYFHLSVSPPPTGLVGVPYSYQIPVVGGVEPFDFTLDAASSLPSGLSLNANTGLISGTPDTVEYRGFRVYISDACGGADFIMGITIVADLPGRNDSIETATTLPGNGSYQASISPSGHPNTVFDPDEDYYRISTTTASTITVDIDAQVDGSPIDTVIEIVNAAGTQLNTCVAPAYTSPCEHDDEELGVTLDSFLQLQVTGATTFYIHVVDWGSNARPDMLYDLIISGVN
jgi:hypothetical protein